MLELKSLPSDTFGSPMNMDVAGEPPLSEVNPEGYILWIESVGEFIFSEDGWIS